MNAAAVLTKAQGRDRIDALLALIDRTLVEYERDVRTIHLAHAGGLPPGAVANGLPRGAR